AGGLLFFSALAFFDVGLLVLPVAVVAMWFVATRSRRWPEALGLVSALGLNTLLLAWANRDYQTPCFPGVVIGSGGHSSCGGVAPAPLVAIGLALLVMGFFGYALLSRGARRQRVADPNASGN